MKHGIHFISGLPRSGSTLLSAILRQNPQFHAEMSSPVAQLFAQLQTGMSGRNEFHVFIDDDQRARVLTGLFENFYAHLAATKTIFDTSRMWAGRIMVLEKLFPEARFICCVRALPKIFDSVERIVRSNPLEPTKMFGFEARGNIYGRVDALTAPNGMVGSAYRGLKDAYYTCGSRNLILVPYDVLTKRPAHTIAELYRFLGAEPFKHDFENVRYEADEFDSRMGARGLHTVSGRVEFRTSPSTLPPDLLARFADTAFWMDTRRNPHGVRVIGVNDGGKLAPPARVPAIAHAV